MIGGMNFNPKASAYGIDYNISRDAYLVCTVCYDISFIFPNIKIIACSLRYFRHGFYAMEVIEF